VKGAWLVATSDVLPDFLTIAEASVLLRLSLTTTYRQANLFIFSDGREGIPTARFGRSMRVLLRQLERLNGGPLAVPPGFRVQSATAPADSAIPVIAATRPFEPKATAQQESRLPSSAATVPHIQSPCSPSIRSVKRSGRVVFRRRAK
jgi:hypothetical protein